MLKSAVHPVQHCVILGLYFSIAGCLRFMCDLSAPHLLFKHLLLGCTLFISFKKGAVPSHSSFREPVLSLDQSIHHIPEIKLYHLEQGGLTFTDPGNLSKPISKS